MLKLLCLDNFPLANRIREEIIKLPFSDHKSEFDSVVYPGIAKDVTPKTTGSFICPLEDILGTKILPTAVFARMMIKGVRAPNKVHSDIEMGKFSALLYLSRHWPRGSGTAFFRWKYDGSEGFEEGADASKIRSNNLEDWEQYALIPAKFGRLLIYDASLWHCALPSEGFGHSPEDARLVLTAFFNISE